MSFNFKNLKREKIDVQSGNSIAFTILGVNGANSYLAYELSQIASLSTKRTDMILIDSENVKKTDLLTDKFIKADLNKNKAKVTAQKCSSAFNLNIETFSSKLKSKEELLNIFNGRMGYFPVFICNNIDKMTAQYLKEALRYMSDAMVLTVNYENNIGRIDITYKENGTFKTKDYLESFEAQDIKVEGKAMYLEASKNLFLLLDDILCERSISIEQIKFDVNQKTTASRYINGDSINIKELVSSRFVKADVNKDILCIVIGLGGTGGSVAYELAHLASISDKNIRIIFIDGDIVEPKNLNRQRFIIQDLNKYKAEVTAERCMKAYGVDISVINEYITSSDDIYKIFKEYEGYTPIILGCSDSLKLRHLVCETVKNAHKYNGLSKDIIYIDAGNGEDYGQINFTYVKDGEYITPDYFQTSPESLNDVFKAKLVTEMSCDELMNSAPQTKGANMSAAIGMYSYLEDVINEKHIGQYITYFNNNNKRVESKKIENL